MLALEIAALDATGVRRTLRWATSAGMTTKPSDLPANTTFFPGVIQPGRITRSLFRPTGETFGTSDLNFGVVEVANDGDWDPLLGWAFDGRTITIRRGSVGDPFPAGWTEVLTGRIDGVEFGQRTITFYIRDAQADVFEALLTEETFAGTTRFRPVSRARLTTSAGFISPSPTAGQKRPGHQCEHSAVHPSASGAD